LQGNSPFKFSEAQSHYSNAGRNREFAGASANDANKFAKDKDVNKLEAAKNYNSAHNDFELAGQQGKDAAKAGNKTDAALCNSMDKQMHYSERADADAKEANDPRYTL
jgi:hypothetical protein